METLKTEDMPRLSRTELRKQKLAEYLAAKGRLKLPNPKPYLKDGAVLKNTLGATHSSHTLSKGKENQPSNATNVKKDIKLEQALTEKNKNFTSRKELRCQSRVPSATFQHSKTTLHRDTLQDFAIHAKGTAAVSNVFMKRQQTKPVLQTVVGNHKQSNVKKDRILIPENVKTSCGSLSLTSCASIAKLELHKKQSAVNKLCSSKIVSRNQIPRTTGNLQDIASGRRDAETQIITQNNQKLNSDFITRGVSCELKNSCSHALQVRKCLVNNSQTKRPRAEMTQKKSVSQFNEQGNKTGPITQKTAPTLEKQRFSKVTKMSDGTKTSVAAVSKRNHISKQQRNTVKLPLESTVQASESQSVPNHSKSQAKITVPTKTPKSKFNPGNQGVRTVPLDERNRPNAAQEERMRKLQEWREARGITYKRPPMPVRPVRRKTNADLPQSYWTTMEQEDEVHGFVCAVDQSLDDCIKLLGQECQIDQVRHVLSRVPMAKKFAKYWICQVRIMERDGNLDVLPMFEEAVRVVREPVDELRSVVFEILRKKEAKDSCFNKIKEGKEPVGQEEEKPCSDMHTPKPVGALIRGAKGDSSVIKYKITATPGGKKSQQRETSGRINGHEIRFFTPVRRSLRIERTAPRYPAALQEHDPCVTSFQDLLRESEAEVEGTCATESPSSPLYVYRENDALKEHVQIELVYEEVE